MTALPEWDIRTDAELADAGAAGDRGATATRTGCTISVSECFATARPPRIACRTLLRHGRPAVSAARG